MSTVVPAVAAPAEAILTPDAVRSRIAMRLAWTLLAVAVALVMTTLLLVALAGSQDPVQGSGWPRVAMPISLLILSTVGFLIATRHARNPIAWILSGAALDGLAGEVAKGYANVGLAQGAGSLPGVEAMAWLACLSAASTAFPILTLGFLLFPDGHLPSPRWRPVAWLAVGTMASWTLVAAVAPGRLALEFPSLVSPFGIEAIGGKVFFGVAHGAFALLLMCVLASLASMVVRLRRASGEERQQLKWVTYAASLVGIETIVSITWHPIPDVQPGVVDGPVVVAILGIAFGVAIFKYRLYDIDVVISKTVVLGTLAVFITSVYVAVVVLLGTAIGAQGGPSLVLSILGAAIVAAAFQPVRERVERFASRLVYGARATPYQVLAEFSERMSSAYAAEELLPRMARLLAEGTGTARADIWLRYGDRLRRVAGWPRGDPLPEPQPVNGAVRSDVRRGTRTILVRHDGEVLGALAVQVRPGSPLSPPDERLMSDLAGQAGLVLRNVRLIEDLRASRERLVTTRDAERRRLEQDIRDRVERRLVAVASALSAATLMGDIELQGRLFEELREETAGALTELRDLARGVYPPLLVSNGLVAALKAQTRGSAVPVSIRAEAVGRYAEDVEAAAYFCCLEALQNVAKHAKAQTATVTLREDDGMLRFTVDDDGVGFEPASTTSGSGLQNMADRAAALGGHVQVNYAPGRGTTISGWLPTRTREPRP